MITGIFGWLPHVTATCRPTVAGPEPPASADAPIKQAQRGADDY
jgi:hypothetical protein